MGASDAAARSAVEIQREYYAATAQRYDEMHLEERGEHFLALRFMLSTIGYLEAASLLDVGSGTGRCLIDVVSEFPSIRAVGIEPSAELREVGYAKGLRREQLIDGDAMKLPFEDRAFDLVCEFGALHHIPKPAMAVAEMLRVAKKAIFISDGNNFGQGGRLSRFVKQTINAVGLWPLADRIKTGGKGYILSEGDGLAYSYSVFNDYKQIREQCEAVHMLNTRDSAPDLYRSASHVALLGIKRRSAK